MEKNMRVTIKDGSETLVEISGRLDTNSSADFEKAIEPILTGTVTNVKVNCSELQYVSSSGLRLFLMLHKTLTRRQGVLCLCNVSPEVKDIFDVTGFSAFFKIQ